MRACKHDGDVSDSRVFFENHFAKATENFFLEEGLEKLSKNIQTQDVVEGLRILPTLHVRGYVNTKKVFYC